MPKFYIVMIKAGLEDVANGKEPLYAFIIVPGSNWEISKAYYEEQGGTLITELELKLPSREEAIQRMLPFLEKEKADIMMAAFKDCQKVDVRKESMLALEALKSPESSDLDDDFPF